MDEQYILTVLYVRVFTKHSRIIFVYAEKKQYKKLVGFLGVRLFTTFTIIVILNKSTCKE